MDSQSSSVVSANNVPTQDPHRDYRQQAADHQIQGDKLRRSIGGSNQRRRDERRWASNEQSVQLAREGNSREAVTRREKVGEEGALRTSHAAEAKTITHAHAPKAVEQSRKLVEYIGILAEVGTIGTVPNVAIQKYLNSKQVPQLLITAGGRRFNDPTNFPWTIPLYPDFETEGRVIAKYILKTRPDAKIGVLYQNDDYGKD